MHHVKDLLGEMDREPICIDPLATVFDALELMQSQNIGALLVVVEGFLVGLVSERDYIRKDIVDHDTAQKTVISEIMTRELMTVEPEDSVVHCIAVMKKHHIRHLPVVVNGKAVGMVSLRDLFLDVVHEKFEDSPQA